MSIGGEHVCAGFGRILDWTPVGIYHARVGDGGTSLRTP